MYKNYLYCWDGRSWPAMCHKLNKTDPQNAQGTGQNGPHFEGKYEGSEAKTTPKGGLSQLCLFILSNLDDQLTDSPS